MLKVLYLPLNDADSVQRGMYDAWKNVGVNLKICDFHRVFLKTRCASEVARDFLENVREFQPDLIHMQLQFTGLLDAGTLNQARTLCKNPVVITNWTGDVRAEAIRDFVKVSQALDYSLISSTGQIEMYERAGCKNVRYWQIGYDPKVNFPMNKTEFKYDVSFIGNNYGKIFPDGHMRVEASNCLHNNFGKRYGLFGSGYSSPQWGARRCDPKECNEIYNDSLACFSLSNFNSIAHYFSDRFLSCVASGRPTISWHFPGIESYFVEGQEIYVARNVQQVADLVNHCKKHPEEANKVGLAGQARALKEHTFTSRIAELLQLTGLSGKV
jgi:spore maturation protein CgeB